MSNPITYNAVSVESWGTHTGVASLEPLESEDKVTMGFQNVWNYLPVDKA